MSKKQSWIFGTWVLALCLGVGWNANGAFGQALTTAKARISYGYLPGWSKVDLKQIPWDYLTHVGHAFLQCDPSGNLIDSPGVPNPECIKLAHQNHVRVLISLGGGKSVTAFEQIVSNEATLNAYVKNVIAFVEKNDYDGIDLDWEFPRDEAGKTGFTKIAKALRAGLDELAKQKEGRKYELTTILSADEHFGKWMDEAVLKSEFDFLKVMTYEMSGPYSRVATHHAPLAATSKVPRGDSPTVEDAIQYWAQRRRIPKEKLCLGIPLYGQYFPVKQPYAEIDPKSRDKFVSLPYVQIRKNISEGWNGSWDQEAMVPWLYDPQHNGVIAFDDRNSVHKKATWGKEYGLGGMFYWALGQDLETDGRSWLIDACFRAWPK